MSYNLQSFIENINNKAPTSEGLSFLQNKTNISELKFTINENICSSIILSNKNFNINNNINVNNNIINFPLGISTNNITSNNILNIHAPLINLKSDNLNFNGNNNNLSIKMHNAIGSLILNCHYDGYALGIGNNVGLQFKSSKETYGYIQTNTNSSNFILKAPLNTTFSYIALLDLNNNFRITGNSKILKDLYITSNTYLNNLYGICWL